MDRKILREGLLELGYEISDDKEQKLAIYSDLLVEWNKKINLTAVTEPVEISVKHFIDSIAPILIIPPDENKKVICIWNLASIPTRTYSIHGGNQFFLLSFYH